MQPIRAQQPVKKQRACCVDIFNILTSRSLSELATNSAAFTPNLMVRRNRLLLNFNRIFATDMSCAQLLGRCCPRHAAAANYVSQRSETSATEQTQRQTVGGVLLKRLFLFLLPLVRRQIEAAQTSKLARPNWTQSIHRRVAHLAPSIVTLKHRQCGRVLAVGNF